MSEEVKESGILTTVKINDFRCLDEVTLDMRNVVALRGNNESGKTSILKALELLMLGGTAAGKYIRSGCRDFRIAGYVGSKDVTVVRTAKGYKVYNGDVTEKSAEKAAKPVTVVDKLTSNETPEVVADIFNLQRNAVTGNMLGSRGYKGKVPFVQTTETENYAIVSEEMGAKPFRDAAYGGILEAGRLEKKAKMLAGNLSDLKSQRMRAKEAVSTAEDMEKVLGDRGALYDAVISALSSLSTIEEIGERMQGAVSGEAPAEIDVDLLSAIKRVRACAASLKEARESLEGLGDGKKAPQPIDIELLQGVTFVRENAKKRKECKVRFEECESELKAVRDQMKKFGGEASLCPVCGAVLLDGRCGSDE